MSGFSMALVSTPIDVVKTRIMNRSVSSATPYQGMVDCLFKVTRSNTRRITWKIDHPFWKSRLDKQKAFWASTRALCPHFWGLVCLFTCLSSIILFNQSHRATHHTGLHHLWGTPKVVRYTASVRPQKARQVPKLFFATEAVWVHRWGNKHSQRLKCTI